MNANQYQLKLYLYDFTNLNEPWSYLWSEVVRDNQTVLDLKKQISDKVGLVETFRVRDKNGTKVSFLAQIKIFVLRDLKFIFANHRLVELSMILHCCRSVLHHSMMAKILPFKKWSLGQKCHKTKKKS